MNLANLVILLAVLAGAGLSVYLVDRFWDHEKRQEHTDVAGFIYAGVAVLYAVMLAFVVIVGWESLSAARTTTYNEANQLSNVYWLAHGLPAPQGPAISNLTLEYAHTVVDSEWPLMGHGDTSLRAGDLADKIRTEVVGFTPHDARQQVLYQQAVESVDGLTAARRDRLDAMTDTVPTPIWIALTVGGLIMVGFCLLFGLRNRTVHIVMVVGVAALVTISLLLINNMQHPFAGDPHIGPGAFEVFLGTLHD